MPIISGSSSSSGSGSTILDVAWTKIGVAHSGDDEFRTGNSVATFTAITTSGTATWLDGGDVVSVIADNQLTDNVAALLKNITIAQGGYVETAVRVIGQGGANFAGVCLTDGVVAGSNVALAYVDYGSAATLWNARHGTLNASSTSAGSVNVRSDIPWTHVRIQWVAANTFAAFFSPDGVTWSTPGVTSFAKTMTPTKMGLCVSTHGAGSGVPLLAAFDYIRCSG